MWGVTMTIASHSTVIVALQVEWSELQKFLLSQGYDLGPGNELLAILNLNQHFGTNDSTEFQKLNYFHYTTNHVPYLLQYLTRKEIAGKIRSGGAESKI